MASSFAGGDTVVCQSSPYLTTGIISGLELQASAGGTTFSVSEGTYQVINMTDIENITFDQFEIGPADIQNIAIPNIAAQDFTYVFLDNTGNYFLKNTPPTVEDVRPLVYLGNLSHEGGAVLTQDATNLGWVAYNNTLLEVQRLFTEGTARLSGLNFNFGPNLTPDLTAGATIRLGSNRLVSEIDPYRISIGASAYGSQVVPFVTLRVSSGAGGIGVNVIPENFIDVSLYDDGVGNLPALGNNRYANHFFYLFPTSAGGYFLFHEYGKAEYLNIQDAIIGATSEAHFDFLQEAAVIGRLTCINNSLDIQASIIAGQADYEPALEVSTLFRL